MSWIALTDVLRVMRRGFGPIPPEALAAVDAELALLDQPDELGRPTGTAQPGALKGQITIHDDENDRQRAALARAGELIDRDGLLSGAAWSDEPAPRDDGPGTAEH
jgi:hypothetical protein